MADAATGAAAPSWPDKLRGGSVLLDRVAHRVTVGGHDVEFALQEFRLLELLMANADRVLASAAILEALWGSDYSGDPGTVTVHVLRVRRKLDRWADAGRHLRTVRGIGYVFDTEPDVMDE